MTTNPHLTAAQADIDLLQALAADRGDQIADLQADLLAEEAEVARITAELEEYKRTHPDLPVPRRTIFGGCPAGGGSSLAAAQTVVDKWGKGAAVRQFLATGAAPRPVDAGVTHHSWKPTLAQITDTWVTSATKALLAGDGVEVWHEADAKVRKGQLTFTDVVARKNKFYDAVKRVRPDLRVVNTLTGQALSDYGKEEWQKWGVVKADLLGLDADGIHDTKAPLDIPYEDEIARVTLFLAANLSYTGWCVPEFGTSRPGWDSRGMERAAWAAKYAALFEAAGAVYVCLYDYESTPGNRFVVASAEFDVWRGLTSA